MFGFKSKKDKRIEYLEKRIRELENAFYQPNIFQKKKGKIAGKILDDLKDRGLYFEVFNDDYRIGGFVLRGTLHFVSNETLSRK